jgi:GR25 family glycosyltransferase involved in LPS biosynthesis
VNFKLFLISTTDGHVSAKCQNLLQLLPESIQDCVSIIDKCDISDANKLNLSFEPVGIINKIFLSQNPASIQKYLTHFSIYKKIVEEKVDISMIFEDEVVFSDVINLLLFNPDFSDDYDIINLSSTGIQDLNAYFLTNRGAQNILNILTDTKWLNGVKRFSPMDYELKEDIETAYIFSSEGEQNFSCVNKIISPIEKLIFCACQYGKLSCLQEIRFINIISNYKTFALNNDLKNLSVDDFSNFSNGGHSINKIFYIHSNSERVKLLRSMLGKTNLPHESFNKKILTACDIYGDQEIKSIFNKSKVLESKKLLDLKSELTDTQYVHEVLENYLSHYKLLESIYAKCQSYHSVIILEDHCRLSDKTIALAESVVSSVDPEWDVIRSVVSSSNELKKISYSHPLCSSKVDLSLSKDLFSKINFTHNNYPSIDPISSAFGGGSHFQIVKVQSIPKILSHLDSEPFLPIDNLYTTNMLNVYEHKLEVHQDFHEQGVSANCNNFIQRPPSKFDKPKIGFIAGKIDNLPEEDIYTFISAKKYCSKLTLLINSSDLKSNKSKNAIYEKYKRLIYHNYIQDLHIYDSKKDLCKILKVIDPDIAILGPDISEKRDVYKKFNFDLIYLSDWPTEKINNL